MDWDHPYITMSYDYEASILRAFGDFVADGYIERKNKTVLGAHHAKRCLRNAEIEYQDRKDPSIYVLFPLEAINCCQDYFLIVANRTVNLLVWTTTPWTLPLNRAVLIKPGATYVVLEINDQLVMVAQALADKIAAMMGVEKKIVAEFIAEQLVASGAQVHHPFIDD